ncbi:MAG: ATP-binding cassette domain-containing protein [Cyanobacteria bacterium P01_F01_bin.56]
MILSTQTANSKGQGALSPLKSVVQLEQVSRIYGTGEAMVKACDRLSLTIHRGEYCAIMGESGSGKTTLMNIIGCLDRPSRCRYQLDAVDVSNLSKNRLARIRNRQIGFVFQRYELRSYALTAK